MVRVFLPKAKEHFLTRCRLFALEGAITGVIGIITYFYLPPSPYQTASRVRGKSWFSEREEKIMANRILRDDPGKGGMHNRWVYMHSDILKKD